MPHILKDRVVSHVCRRMPEDTYIEELTSIFAALELICLQGPTVSNGQQQGHVRPDAAP